MIKFSIEYKRKVVECYLEGKRSALSIGREYGTDESTVRLWVKQYKQYGREGFVRKRRSYDVKFKLLVLKHLWEHEATYSDTALLFDIRRPGCIGEWERGYRSGGIEALLRPPTRKPVKTMSTKPTESTSSVSKEDESRSREELIKELNDLRMENAYLKKLKALVQKQAQASPNKRK
jgi:transposase